MPPSWWVSTGEHWLNRSGTIFDSKGERKHVRTFLVIVNSKIVDDALVCTAPGLPAPFSSYMNAEGQVLDPLCLMTNLSAKQRDSDDWQAWLVTATYSTKVPAGGPSSGQGTPDKNNPELEPADWSWGCEEGHIALQEDLDGKPFVNSAGDPFIPAFSQPLGYPLLTISRNELNWGQVQAKKYNYVVNSDVFGTNPAGTVFMYPPQAKTMWKGTYQFFRVTYKLKFFSAFEMNRLGWQPYILDQGMRQLTVVPFPAGGVNKTLPVPIFEGGHAVAHPVCLDGLGRRAVRNQNAANGPLGKITPVYLTFRTLPDVPFKPLNLEQYL